MAASIRTQILNGFRLAGIGFAAFALILLIFHGLAELASEPDSAGHWASTAAGLAELSIAGLCLFLTSKSWAK
jgi:hypothetical protein